MQSYKLQSMLSEYDDLLPGAPLPMTGNRQYDRKRKRMLEEMEPRIENACKADYLCQAAYNMGFNRGLQRGNEFALKDGYAAALLTANSNRLIVKVKVRDFEELEKQGCNGRMVEVRGDAKF